MFTQGWGSEDAWLPTAHSQKGVGSLGVDTQEAPWSVGAGEVTLHPGFQDGSYSYPYKGQGQVLDLLGKCFSLRLGSSSPCDLTL